MVVSAVFDPEAVLARHHAERVSAKLWFTALKQFSRAILLSGSALSTWATSDDPLDMTRRLAERLNCSHVMDTSPLLKEVLRVFLVELMVLVHTFLI